MKFTLATRGSPLALWQANEAKRLLLARFPEMTVDLLVVQSAGDKDKQTELARFGLTGIFTAEVDHAVVSGAAHAGVHSLKDMTTTLHERLTLAGCLARGPVEDVLLTRDKSKLSDLESGARVGTGSVRRVAMIKRLRPDLELVGIRGNVETRLKKLQNNECDALVMARAGLERLGLVSMISDVFDIERSVPAVGQGIVGLTGRVDDQPTIDALKQITHTPSFAAARAERALLHALHGGCNAPVGGHARCHGHDLELRGRVMSLDGTECLEDHMRGDARDAVQLGEKLAARLITLGAKRLIDAARTK
ncbi:MAG: hydroxymethylbilane synthase [Planctomycetota bacterium]|nr:hydroxymethylbilane synthase [Planctomycetota bacterium]